MQNIQEGGDGVTGGLANVSLLHEGLVEDGDGGLGFLIGVTTGLLSFCLLARRGAGDVESHLDEFILSSPGLLALCLAIRLSVLVDRELNGDLIAAC